MKEIQFTLRGSDVWHVIKTEFDIFNELQCGQVVSNIIVEQMKLLSEKSAVAEKVIIKDENGKPIAQSPDITKVEYLTFINK